MHFPLLVGGGGGIETTLAATIRVKLILVKSIVTVAIIVCAGATEAYTRI